LRSSVLRRETLLSRLLARSRIMGVEYRYLLIPRDNTHRPDSSAVERLIRAWRDHDFAVQPGSPRHAAMNFRTHSASTRMRRRQAHPS
jgi:hypothetical protein